MGSAKWSVPFIVLCAAAGAQEPETVDTIPVPESPPPVSGEPAQLDEITVTAQKRAQSLQKTPISIEAFDLQEIQLRGIEGLRDLAAQVPNMTVEPFPTHNATLRLFIRGVGPTDAQLTQDPAVGIYVDGVYVARSVGLALDIADLERIEVLRGPQGTLYGRNTTGGAVNLITRKPMTGVLSMTHKISFGDRNQMTGKSSINVPVTDDLAVKLAVLANRQEGYVENTGPGGDFGDREVSAIRFDAAWQAADWLTANYAYDHNDLQYYNYMYQSVLRPNTSKGQGDLFKGYAQTQTLYSGERLESLASGAPYEQSGTKVDGHALTLASLIGPYELKYIGAYRELWDAEYADLAGGTGSTRYRLDSNYYDGPAATEANGGPTPLVIPTVTQEQWSHELQLSGLEFGESLQFLVGLFYFTENAVEDRHKLNHQLSTGIASDDPRLVNFVDLWWSIDNEAKAAFTELTWTPPWLLVGTTHWTVGYRHSEDRRDALKFRISDTYVESGGSASLLSSAERFDYVPASREFKDDSFSYGASVDVTPSVNVYAKSVEAYKSGGYNVRDPNVSGATADPQYGFGFIEGFEPEHVRSYELGAKTEWFGRRLRVNADVFHSDYRDLQINFLLPGTISDTKVRNAGKAEMDGVELDVKWLVLRDMVLTANGAYLDADVEEVIDPQGNNVAHLFPFYSAPEYTGGASLDWTFWDFGWADLRGYVGWNYVGERGGLVITEERRGLTSLEAYDMWTARLLLQGVAVGDSGVLDFGVFGRNLADEKYAVSAIDNVPQADRAVIWGEPRTFGVDAIYRFN
jgi:iron complex outermembrane recepter protein